MLAFVIFERGHMSLFNELTKKKSILRFRSVELCQIENTTAPIRVTVKWGMDKCMSAQTDISWRNKG